MERTTPDRPPRTIAILGCGWLGLPLGAYLVRQGYHVKGSTTTPEKLGTLAEAGIEPYLLRLDSDPGSGPGQAVQDDDAAGFFEADVLFLNIPPGRRDPDVRVKFGVRIEAVQQRLREAPVGHVVFASSTSVYPNLNRVVVEEDAGDPPTASGQALVEAEEVLRSDGRFGATVVRFAGLYGYSRQPGRFLAGKEVQGGSAPVNLIHRDDSVAIVAAIIERDVRGEVFNACADEHPTRRALYTQKARQLGLEPPTFQDDEPVPFKIVSNAKLKRHLGYAFRHPDPMEEAP